MIIQRRFEPEPEVLERVVEILYGLLVEAPDAGEQGASKSVRAAEAPCFSTECEG